MRRSPGPYDDPAEGQIGRVTMVLLPHKWCKRAYWMLYKDSHRTIKSNRINTNQDFKSKVPPNVPPSGCWWHEKADRGTL